MQIPIPRDKRGEAPFSVDANLMHVSSEGKVLEDPWEPAADYIWSNTTAPEEAPDKPTFIEVGFEKGDAMSIDRERLIPAAMLPRLNAHGPTTATIGQAQ